jgi:uncharacterized membrane-anchored protein YjiN (DUF445 family)
MKKVLHLSKDELKNKIKSLIQEQEETESNDFPTIVSQLLFSQTQVHIFHLQTKSFAEHNALQDYYDGIDDLVDTLIESYQGEFGIIENYKSFKVESYQDTDQVIAYFEMILNLVKEGRETIESTHLQNILDEIITLVTKTMYKLKFLK